MKEGVSEAGGFRRTGGQTLDGMALAVGSPQKTRPLRRSGSRTQNQPVTREDCYSVAVLILAVRRAAVSFPRRDVVRSGPRSRSDIGCRFPVADDLRGVPPALRTA
jgi:hypothetical protein